MYLYVSPRMPDGDMYESMSPYLSGFQSISLRVR